MIYAILFIEFCKVGLFCVGGGYASMPLIQHCVVDTYHWMTMSEFVDIFTLSQMMPGAIGLNAATFAGTRIAGLGGAICASVEKLDRPVLGRVAANKALFFQAV